MQDRSSRRFMNPLSILGAAMAIFSAIIILVLLLLNITGSISNPYTGILAFMVGPVVLVVGLLLIPLGVLLEGRRQPRERALPVIDLNQPHQQKRIALFTIATFLILVLMAITTWEAATFMETPVFCGQVCHDVMQPEEVAHADSPHARVACVNCHIGPGAEWFVRSKISGLNQVVAVALNSYERPIPTPIENLRPARGTCEECHWPAQFTGTTIGLFYDFAADEQNTLTVQPMAFKVGGATFGRGIH
ncbi:MAG: NapC/NirT family cytochrome c, partial [Chloroflexota bacterium]